MIIGMDYHIEQVPMCCRVCGQSCGNPKQSKRSYECNASTADLKIAFDINTSGDDVNTHHESFCLLCKHLMERTISAIMKGVPQVYTRQCISVAQTYISSMQGIITTTDSSHPPPAKRVKNI